MVDSIIIRDKSKTKVIQGTPSAKSYKSSLPASRSVRRVEKAVKEKKQQEAVRKTVERNKERVTHKRHHHSSSRSSNKTITEQVKDREVVTPDVSVPTLQSKPMDTPVGSRIKEPGKIDAVMNKRVKENRDNAEETRQSSINLRRKRDNVYAAQDAKPDNFSVSSLNLSGRTAEQRTRSQTKDELKESAMKNLQPYMTTHTSKITIPGSDNHLTGTKTSFSLKAPESKGLGKLPIIGNLFKTKEQKEYEANLRLLASTQEKRSPDKEQVIRNINYMLNRPLTQVAIGLSKKEGLKAFDRITKADKSTEELERRRREINRDIIAQGENIRTIERPSEMLVSSLAGSNAAKRVLDLTAERNRIDKQLASRGVSHSNLLSGERSAFAPSDLETSKVVAKDWTSINKGLALEGAEAAASAGISAGAIKLAQKGKTAYRAVQVVDKVDELQDAYTVGKGIVQIGTGNVAGGANTLLTQGITEGAARYGSRGVGGTFKFTPDVKSKVTLKDKFFPKGDIIEFEGVDLTGSTKRNVPGIERINAQLHGRTVPDTDLPKEIPLKGGKVQSESGEVFTRSTQYGKLQSIGNKEIRGNKFKDAWKGMWRSKKASLVDTSAAFGPDFTPSSRFDVTPDVVTSVKPEVALKPDTTFVESLKIGESESLSHHRSKLRVSPDFSARTSPELDLTTTPDITVKPDITPTIDETIDPGIDDTIDSGVDDSTGIDETITPDITTKLDIGSSFGIKHPSLGLTPALSAMIGKPKRGRRHIKLPRGYQTYTVENKILDISQPFKSKLRSYNRIKIPINNKRIKLPIGITRQKKGRIYSPKKLKGFM